MRLDISEVLREVGKILPYDIQEPPLVDEDLECIAPIEGKVNFNNTGGILLVRGDAATTVALPCSRCGVYFEQPVAIKIDEQFELKHISAGPRTMATVSIVEEDENPAAGKLFDGHVFDLTEMLRQYIVLEEPTQPLPPVKPDGKCAHCDKLPADILKGMAIVEEEAFKEPINSVFASLSQLLNKEDK